MAYELVRNGLMQSDYDEMKGIRISDMHIEQFTNEYVSLAELARNQSCSPRKLLSTLGATPVTGPNIDGSRQYFYRRDAIPETIE